MHAPIRPDLYAYDTHHALKAAIGAGNTRDGPELAPEGKRSAAGRGVSEIGLPWLSYASAGCSDPGQPSGTCLRGSMNGIAAVRPAVRRPSGATISSSVPGPLSSIGIQT